MPVYNGVEYHEFAAPQSPSFSVRPMEESRARMRVYLDWADITSQAASAAFLGTASVAQNFGGVATPKYIVRTNAFSHPDWPDSFLIADGMDVESDLPTGISAEGTALSDKGKTTLSFRNIPWGYRLLPDEAIIGNTSNNNAANNFPFEGYLLRCMEIETQATAKSQTLPPPSALQWRDSGGRAVTATAFVTLWEVELTIRWWPVPLAAFNEERMHGLVGKTNAAVWPPPPPPSAVNAGVVPLLSPLPPGSVVMGAPVKRLIRMGDGEPAWHVTLRAKFYPAGGTAFGIADARIGGANRLFWHDRPAGQGGPGYHPILRPDNSLLFPTADYNAAFLPP